MYHFFLCQGNTDQQWTVFQSLPVSTLAETEELLNMIWHVIPERCFIVDSRDLQSSDNGHTVHLTSNYLICWLRAGTEEFLMYASHKHRYLIDHLLISNTYRSMPQEPGFLGWGINKKLLQRSLPLMLTWQTFPVKSGEFLPPMFYRWLWSLYFWVFYVKPPMSSRFLSFHGTISKWQKQSGWKIFSLFLVLPGKWST